MFFDTEKQRTNHLFSWGFTLVELLAVIAILAIILSIAVPTILGVIESSKQDAFKDSTLSIFKAVEMKAINEGKYSGLVSELELNNNRFLTGTWAYNKEDNAIKLTQVCDGNYKADVAVNNNADIILNKDDGTCGFEIIIEGNNPDNVSCHNTNKYVDEGATYGSNKITSLDKVDLRYAGNYTLKYQYGSFKASRLVTVTNDNIPTLELTHDNIVISSTNTTFKPSDYIKTATDDCEGNIKDKVSITTDVLLGVPGTYTVTYTLSNLGNKSVTKTMNVQINEHQLIVIGNNPDNVSCHASNSYTDQGAKYNFDESIIKYAPSLSLKNAGTYRLNYEYVVEGMNLTTSRTVNVSNTNKPTIALSKTNITVPSVTISFTPSDYLVSAVDNCEGDIKSLVKTTSNVVLGVPGTYTVTYEVANKGGVKDTKTLTVVVGESKLVVNGNNPDNVSCHISNNYTDLGATYNFDSSITKYGSVLSLKNAGSYTLNYSYVINGKTLTTKRTVNITNTNTPTLEMTTTGIKLYVDDTFNASDYIKEATDPCEGDLKGNVLITSDVNMSVSGNYTTVYKVKK